jgi:hypothetical protein
VAWASSSGDDLSALNTTISGALVEGSRLQPPIDKMLGQRMAVALDEDSEGSASNEEEEAEVVVEEEEGELVAAAGVAAGLASDSGAAAARARLDKEIELDGSSRRRVLRRGRAPRPGRWRGSTVLLHVQWAPAMPALQPTARGDDLVQDAYGTEPGWPLRRHGDIVQRRGARARRIDLAPPYKYPIPPLPPLPPIACA